MRRAVSGMKADEQRAAIIAAAYQLAVCDGLEGLRTRGVAQEAGITIATLHYYFPGKSDLTRGVIGYAIDQQIARPLRNGEEGLPRLLSMMTGLLKQSATEPGRFRLLNDIVWRAKDDPAIDDVIAEWHRRWHTYLAEQVAVGQRRGDIRSDLAPDAAAALIMQLALGSVLRPTMLRPYEISAIDTLERILRPTERRSHREEERP